MRSSYRWVPVLALGLGAGIFGAAPASSTETARPTPPATAPNGPGLAGEEKYWTADRMKNAVPADGPAAPA
ncbi:hypothetical protein GTY91_01200, partial [Streptomyces sp. SID69]|nr:hypothetical protein [Streptomyces sp. SID69]